MRRDLALVAVASLVLSGLALAPAFGAAPPANDAFADATPVPGIPFNDSVDIGGATTEPGEPAPTCAPIGHTAWYRFVAAESGELSASTRGSGFDTVLAVYEGGGLGSLTEIACNDDRGGGSTESEVRISAVVGTTYHVQAGGFLTKSGQLAFAMLPPPNDDFLDARPIGGLPFSDLVPSTSSFTLEPGEPEPTCGYQTDHSAWYRFTPVANVQLALDTFESNYDTVLAVYTGSALNNLTEVACNDQAGSNQSFVALEAVEGATYHVQVTGWWRDSGMLGFNATALDVVTRSDHYVGQTLGTQSDRLLRDCANDLNVGGACFELAPSTLTVSVSSATDALTGELPAVYLAFRDSYDGSTWGWGWYCVPSEPIAVPWWADALLVHTGDPVINGFVGCGPGKAATTGTITVSVGVPAA